MLVFEYLLHFGDCLVTAAIALCFGLKGFFVLIRIISQGVDGFVSSKLDLRSASFVNRSLCGMNRKSALVNRVASNSLGLFILSVGQNIF